MTGHRATTTLATALLGGLAVTAPSAIAASAPTQPTSATAPRGGVTVTAAWRGTPEVPVSGRMVARGRIDGLPRSTRPSALVRLERRAGTTWVAVRATTVAGDGSWAATFAAPNRPSAQTYRVRLFLGGTPTATTTLPVLDVYRRLTYTITTRGAVRADLATFARTAAATYDSPQGWRRAHLRFTRVTRGGDFTLVLAQSRTMRTFSRACSPLYSCRAGRNVVINETPWLHATPAWTGTLTDYRRMVLDHETGHFLGFGHAVCPRPGAPAPVMQQQSKSLQGCRPNPWPLATEIARVP